MNKRQLEFEKLYQLVDYPAPIASSFHIKLLYNIELEVRNPYEDTFVNLSLISLDNL